MDDDIVSTSRGLLRCLQALAEETASLGLTRTYFALQDAIGICGVESGAAIAAPAVPFPAGMLH